jgi:hypothetical protein
MEEWNTMKRVKQHVKRTTIFLHQTDLAAVETLRSRFGLASDSDTIRFALRLVAQSQVTLSLLQSDDRYGKGKLSE